MKIELLYFDGCPNWQTTLEEVQNILAEKLVHESVELIRVASNKQAKELQVPGSPTLRIDGEDVELDAQSSGFQLACRVYEVDGKLAGKPPIEWIDAAIEAALG